MDTDSINSCLELAILSEYSLSECWNSPEDEAAFAYLQ